MTSLIFCLMLVIAVLTNGENASTIHLFPKTVNVMENSSVTLTCSKANGHLLETRWTNSQILDQDANLYYYNGQCMTTRFLENNDLFHGVCNENGTFSVVLNRIDRLQHGAEWQCKEAGTCTSNKVVVNVIVPVKAVEMTSHMFVDKISIKENSTTTFKCIASPSRPTPTIFWFLSSSDGRTTINLTAETSRLPTFDDSDSLIEVASVLNYTVARRFNGWHINCLAANMPHQNVLSRKKYLNVLFPPDGNPTLIGANSGIKYRTVEYQEGKLSCALSGGNPLANLTWLCFNGTVSSFRENATVKSSVTWSVHRSQDKKYCVCVAEHLFGKSKVSVINEVLYPPGRPVFKIGNTNVVEIINIIQHNSLSVTCESNSNPESDYAWIGKFVPAITGQTLSITDVQKHDSGQHICKVNNTMVGSDGEEHLGVNTSSITVHLLFPPNRPTFRYVDNTNNEVISDYSIDVITGDSFTLICQSTGQPTPYYVWDNGRNVNTQVIRAVKSFNTTCTATNTMIETVGEIVNGSESATLDVSVLYPPNIPRIRLYDSKGNKVVLSQILNVAENDSFSLTCDSESRPNPKYKWHVNNTDISFQRILKKVNISRYEGGIYGCIAFNTMTRTFGSTQTRYNNRSVEVNILYPAKVGDMETLTIVEGGSVNVTCPITPGNPQFTSVKWATQGGYIASSNRILILSNISRNEKGIYTCYVNSTMKPTHSLPIWKIDYRQFQLIVAYKSVVTQFYVAEETDKKIVIANETNDVTFRCNADGKPIPNVYISHNGNTIYVSNHNSLVYAKTNVRCADFGTYVCSSTNDYNNGKPSIKSLTLFVNCSPRPSPFVELNKNVASTRNTIATLSFTALAYPEPGQSGFSWYYMNGSERILLTNSENVIISSSFLQSNITIRNVTNSYFGQYILEIENAVGVFEQTFLLKPFVSTTDRNNFAETSEVLDFVGVGAGTFITTVIIFGFVCFVYRRSRLRCQCKQRFQNPTRRNTRKNSDVTVYDQIRMSNIERRTYQHDQGGETETVRKTESTLQYERLDNSVEEKNHPATYEQLKDASKERNGDRTMDQEEKEWDIQDYINIKI